MKLTVIAVAAAAIVAMPVSAATYDAFSSFTGTHTGGAFTYGVFDGSAFTPYNDTAGCTARLSGTICTSNGDLPAAFKTTAGAHSYGTVNIPGDALLLHPGPNAGEASAVVFTLPAAAKVSFTFSAAIADINPSGVNIVVFVPGAFTRTLATLTAASPSFTIAPNLGARAAGFQLGYAVDYDGNYSNDSTAINYTVTTTAVPEPASWTLLIAGFGLIGVAARRRRDALAA